MLTQESFEKIDREVAKYPEGQSRAAVMSALRIAQTEKGWLSEELIRCVADYLKIPPMLAYEVATFYNMYDLKPVGRHKLTICTNLPCALRGANKAAQALQDKLGIGFGETTPDGKFTLCEGECFGACQEAPVCLHNNHEMLTHMTPEQIDHWLEEVEK